MSGPSASPATAEGTTAVGGTAPGPVATPVHVADDGSRWAVWRLELPTYALLPAAAKLALHSRVRDALSALDGPAHVVGVCRPLQPAEVATGVAGGVRPGWEDAWAATARADLRSLLAAGPVERRTYLAVQLAGPTVRGALAAAAGAVATRFGVVAARPRTVTPGRDDEVAARAASTAARLGRSLALHPVQPPELRWLRARALLRGLDDPPPPDAGTARPPAVDEVVLWEGGRPDDPHRPRHRRYVRVDTDRGTAFQTTVVVADMPAAFGYPDGGGEWLAALAAAPVAVDWTLRIQVVPNAVARERARRQQRQLAAQRDEHAGQPAGPPAALATAIDGVDEQHRRLAERPADPELEVTTTITVAARTLPELDARAAVVAGLLEPRGYGLHRPTGGQVPLLLGSPPASAAPAVCRDYVQHLLPADLAAAAPTAGTALGDPQGIPVGLSRGGGGAPVPVLLDPTRGPATDRSGSIGVFGALGSGKSYLVKRLLLGAVARGGQVVALDRTAVGEYARLAGVAQGRTAVVALDAGADVCLDPLVVLGGPLAGPAAAHHAVRAAVAALCTLTRTTTTDVDGAILAKAVRRVAAAGGRSRDVLDLLAREDVAETRGLRHKLDVHAEDPLAGLLLGDGRPVELGAADLVVVHAPGLALPDRDAEVGRGRDPLPEQLLGQALLHVVAAVARSVTIADPGRFGALLVDEAWALAANPHGRQLLLDAVRDGRKHNAAVWLASQHPRDLGDDALTHLLGIRAVFRQARAAAPDALRFLGLDPTDALVSLVSEDLPTGHCLLRDTADRVGPVEVLPAADPAVHAALRTTPAAAA